MNIWSLFRHEMAKIKIKAKATTPERFELERVNPMYLAGTSLNHSAKASRFYLNSENNLFLS